MVSAISLDAKLKAHLKQRAQQGLLRKLSHRPDLIDFCSNDYLGFEHNDNHNYLNLNDLSSKRQSLGSTGSRLISGNSSFAEQLEVELATYHSAPAGLLFNSGYSANMGLFQCLAQRGDTILYDQYCHASIIDGIRLSHANRFKFRHNDMEHLEQLLLKAQGTVFIAVESIYSMDGDSAPLCELALLSEKYKANLIVDEAHATGVFGDKGEGLVLAEGLAEKVFARVHTFGKALACHGAIVLGSNVLRDYLINFSRSFIYTTALPLHSLKGIKTRYTLLASSAQQQTYLHQLIAYFKKATQHERYLVALSDSAIQSVVVVGNQSAKKAQAQLQEQGFDVRAILSPTVPEGKERLRICLHAHNTFSEVNGLIAALKKAIT